MALTVPDSDALRQEMRMTDEFEDEQSDYADTALQQATDLLELATDVHDDPQDELLARTVTFGILAMAHALYVRGDDADATYSPFSSERIGSYSYSKMAGAALNGSPTGVQAFDVAVRALASSDEDSFEVFVTSENVFGQPYGEDDIAADDENRLSQMPDWFGA